MGGIMKQKMLIVGITMAAAGSEKSFLSFASHAIDYNKYDVDLLLAQKSGDFLSLVPPEIRILEMGAMGELFILDRRNAKSIIQRRYLAKNPFRAFGLLPYIIGMKKAKTREARSFAANRMWLHMMETMPDLPGEYDVSLAYWGDRTMFYMIDKVRAKKKIAWLHFDYSRPPREDALYLDYFQKCDKVVTVSAEIERSLKAALPAIADKVITVENIIDREAILAAADAPADFGDDFDGIRLLTVGRICAQKGYDLAVPALARLAAEGYHFKWYIIGQGEKDEVSALKAKIQTWGMAEHIVLLGMQKNPYPFMRAADIYMQPSRHEGKPIAVEEAKILCKPIFVTNYTAAEEQMAGGGLGVIGEISEDGIYNGMKTLLSDAAFQENLRNALAVFAENSGKNTDYLGIFE